MIRVYLVGFQIEEHIIRSEWNVDSIILSCLDHNVSRSSQVKSQVSLFPFEYTYNENNIFGCTFSSAKCDDGVDLRQALINCRHEPDANEFLRSGLKG
jgi:hypothetical protein